MGDPQEQQPSTLEIYSWFVAKEKAIYTALNMLGSRDPRDATYTGYVWAPLLMEQLIKEALTIFPTVDFTQYQPSNPAEAVELTPPTYFKTTVI